jgi:mevalonate kinase
MNRYYSNGKLLLTGEYVVLDGATALALPTKFGQDLIVENSSQNQLIWESYTSEGERWFEAVFDFPKIRLVNATFSSKEEGSHEHIAETLQNLLLEARKLNSNFLQSERGFIVKTHLTFPRDWGLGSSSTLINNIAQWANVDPFALLWNAFSGSGYDIACAKNDMPIFYSVINKIPKVEKVHFNPDFKDELFFVHLNQKQNSREGIQRYRQKRVLQQACLPTRQTQQDIESISQISKDLLQARNLSEFENLMNKHEQIISNSIELPTVKEKLFADYFGAIKSLGAWGGDFVLATGNETTPRYFQDKGFATVIPYQEMIL